MKVSVFWQHPAYASEFGVSLVDVDDPRDLVKVAAAVNKCERDAREEIEIYEDEELVKEEIEIDEKCLLAIFEGDVWEKSLADLRA